MRIFIPLLLINSSQAAVGGSANSKLRKAYRNFVEIFDTMQDTPITKQEHEATIDAALADQEDSLTGRRFGDTKTFREGDGMISNRIHESWTKKITKQVRFLQKKYNSDDCERFGISGQSDVLDVWGEIIDSDKIEDQYDQFKKLVWTDPNQTLRVKQPKLDKPLTTLHLFFGKLRLWIDEHIGGCYDENKIVQKKANGASRVKKWTIKAHKKFNTMESRVCKHLYKGLVRTTIDDNPYHSNMKCDSDKFKQKHREKVNEEKKAQREEKLKNKKNKKIT